MAPHMCSQSVSASVRHPLPRTIIPFACILCPSTPNMFVMYMLNQIIHIAHILLTAIPFAYSHLFGMIEVIVPSTARRTGDRTRGIRADVRVVVGARRMVVREQRRVCVVREGDGGGAFRRRSREGSRRACGRAGGKGGGGRHCGGLGYGGVVVVQAVGKTS